MDKEYWKCLCIRLVVYFVFVVVILGIAFLFHEYGSYFLQELQEKTAQKGSLSYYHSLSWLFSGLLLAVAFAVAFVGAGKTKIDKNESFWKSIKPLTTMYFEYILFYGVFLIAFDIGYQILKYLHFFSLWSFVLLGIICAISHKIIKNLNREIL